MIRQASIAFLAGILLCHHLPRLPELAAYWFIILILGGISITVRFPGWYLWFFILLGFCWAIWCAQLILAQALPIDLEQQTVTISGVIKGLPQPVAGGWHFRFRTDKLLDAKQRVYPSPGLVRLTWYDPTANLRPGQRWQLSVRLKRPHGLMNPGGFDYTGWLFQQRIRAIGYVYQKAPQAQLSPAESQSLNAARWQVAENLREQFAHSPATALLIALTVGVRHDISQAQWDVLRRTGTAHLMAISGLHIGLAAFWAAIFTRWSVALLALFVWQIPTRYTTALFAGGAALSYALLAGFSIPTQRALIMVLTLLAGLWFKRQMSLSSLLALALLLVLIRDPLAPLSAGFWLSFGAVCLIGFVVSARRPVQQKHLRWLYGFWSTQWAITLGLLPILLHVFGLLSVSALLANFIAIPWMSFIIVPLTLAGVLLQSLDWPVASFLLNIAHDLMHALWQTLTLLSDWQWSALYTTKPPLWATLLALIGVLILLLPRTFPARWAGFCWLLPALFLRQPVLADGELHFTLLDVGQGLSAVVRTRSHTLIYDSGAAFPSGFDMGEAVVVPYLRQQGIHHVDTLLISHADNDHIGGAHSVQAQIPVKQTLTSAPDQLPGSVPCAQQSRWMWDGVVFEILHPRDNSFQRSRNNRSCVLHIHSRYGSLLLSGDIERMAEYHLLRLYADRLQADVLVIPHHGSRTSSTPAFIDSVKPALALIPAGYQNRFGHPHQEVVQRYQSRQIPLLNTANTGAIEIQLTAEGWSAPVIARNTMQRYWHESSFIAEKMLEKAD